MSFLREQKECLPRAGAFDEILRKILIVRTARPRPPIPARTMPETRRDLAIRLRAVAIVYRPMKSQVFQHVGAFRQRPERLFHNVIPVKAGNWLFQKFSSPPPPCTRKFRAARWGDGAGNPLDTLLENAAGTKTLLSFPGIQSREWRPENGNPEHRFA